LICISCVACLLLITNTPGNMLLAGGFDRFGQGIDLLFDRGKFVVDTSVSYITPHRKYDTVNGIPETVYFGVDRWLPSVNFKFTPFNAAACLAAYRQPFGADTDYGSTWSQSRRAVSRSLQVEEFGLTCSYRVPAADGYMRVIGGITKDFASSQEDAIRVLPNGTVLRPAIDLEGSAWAWRAGLAYEVPAKFVRATLMYYSPMDFSASGTFKDLPLGGNAFFPVVPVHADASVPQTVEGVLQFPIAQAWLNTVSVKWANWSSWTRVPVGLSANSGPLPAGFELSTYNAFFRDGWTIANTVAHRWSSDLTLSVGVSWDRGVGTGWTEHTDTWSASLGSILRLNDSVDLITGVGLSLLTAGEVDKRAQGGSYDATFDTGYAVSARVGLRARF
jgi:long-chain fatty acid transport protein